MLSPKVGPWAWKCHKPQGSPEESSVLLPPSWQRRGGFGSHVPALLVALEVSPGLKPPGPWGGEVL